MVTITKNGEIYQLNDNGVITDLKVVQPKGWDPTLELPENSTGRKLMNVPKLDAALAKDPVYELKAKSERKTSTKSDTPRVVKGLEEYLDDDDKALFLELKAKAIANREESRKKTPMTDIEKAQRALERAQATYDKLLAASLDEELGELEDDNTEDAE